MYVKIPEVIYSDDDRRNHVMKLKPNSYGLKDAAKIWNDLVATMFE